jgi:RNA polymerase sigma-70 factor, ECF subfamily
MDEDLVMRAKTDREAFGLLYDQFHPIVTRYCMRRLFDRTSAEDVVSDVFTSVATKLRTFPGQTESDFRRWLFRIATNAVNAHLRQLRRRQEICQAAARFQPQQLDHTGDSKSQWDVLDWPAVYQAVLELNEREQTILTLRFFAGCSH